MLDAVRRYAHWLHLRWPAGTIEPLPEQRHDGGTALPGVTITGDLTGTPLLKFALDSGARAARRIAEDPRLRDVGDRGTLDLVIIGAGASGMAAALEARRRGLAFALLEATEAFSTLVQIPRAKPIFTYPRAMTPEGALQVSADVKEALVEELREQAARSGVSITPGRAERIARAGPLLEVRLAEGPPLTARRVIVAIGRSGSFRRLGVPGETLDKVFNRLHDPADFSGLRALVVGGGDAAVETAIALVVAGAEVTLAHRGSTLSRPKHENLETLERLRRDPSADVVVEPPSGGRVTTAAGAFMGPRRPAGGLTILPDAEVREIRADVVVIDRREGGRSTIPNDVVFTMIGRHAPLDFFRRSGIAIAGEMTPRRWASLALFVAFCAALYDWKSGGRLAALWARRHWFPTNLPDLLAGAGGPLAAAAANPATLLGTLAISAASPSFAYTLVYSIAIAAFGWRRIRRRRTPYVTAQTLTLVLVQIVPLFLLPEVVLPLLHHTGHLPRGLADALFPVCDYGHGREFWRAYGLILAWPLDVYNVFTHRPLPAWLAISCVQTLVLIPAAIYFFGKGAYCGWVCSCGALAETLGDTHRHKMPHGPRWNRLNLAGQGVLAVALVLLGVRVAGWCLPPGNAAERLFEGWLEQNYKWAVDVTLAGVLGTGLYFWFSGRVWCRFFCPLAALMHVYARFSRFRIFADKKKCISCGQCTTACHQGIDVMSFANKGAALDDPQCVRCSACVHTCPTGVLSFGRLERSGLVTLDSLRASPVRMREGV